MPDLSSLSNEELMGLYQSTSGGGGGSPLRVTVTPDEPPYNDAISKIESGGNYRAIGPTTRTGDRAFGKYQVMGANIGPWTKETLGRELTRQEFLTNPDAQEAVFKAKFGEYAKKHGPEGAARAWFAGEGGMNDPNRRDILGTSVADYSRKFTGAMGFAPEERTQVAQASVQAVPQPEQSKSPLSAMSDEDLIAAYRANQPAPQPAEVTPADVPEPEKKPFTLADTWPARIAKSIASGVTLPRDVLMGKVDPLSDEGIKRALDLAAVGTPVGAATRAGAGFMGMSKSVPPGEVAARAGQYIGVDVPKAAASDSMIVQRTGQALSNVPIGGSSLRQAGEQATQQLGEAVERVSVQPTGTKVIPETAGQTVREGLQNYIGPVTEGRATKLYDAVDNLVNPNVTAPLPATQAAAAQILARRANSAQAGQSGAVKEIANAIIRPGGLNYQGIKDLRTAVGEKLKGGILPADISQGELKAIYSGLSDDLASAVTIAGGPRAKAAFERANNYYKLVSERRENLAGILGTRSDEGIFAKVAQLAGSTASADVKLLAQARKAMPADEWADVSSAVIAQLGKSRSAGTSGPVSGAQPGEFSPALFVRDYGKLSEQGKNILFNSIPEGKALRTQLDLIARVSERSKAWQRFANPSGTGQTMIGNAQIAGFGAAAMAGFMNASLVEPLTAVGAVVGTGLLSRVLSRPATAAPVAQWSRAYELAVLRPGASTFSTLNIASRNLANTLADKLGLNVSPTDFLRAIQGPLPVRPEEQQP